MSFLYLYVPLNPLDFCASFPLPQRRVEENVNIGHGEKSNRCKKVQDDCVWKFVNFIIIIIIIIIVIRLTFEERFFHRFYIWWFKYGWKSLKIVPLESRLIALSRIVRYQDWNRLSFNFNFNYGTFTAPVSLYHTSLPFYYYCGFEFFFFFYHFESPRTIGRKLVCPIPFCPSIIYTPF